jgi:hypothetical protein
MAYGFAFMSNLKPRCLVAPGLFFVAIRSLPSNAVWEAHGKQVIEEDNSERK